MCGCRAEFETTERFLFRCHFYSPQKSELVNDLEKTKSDS